MEPLHPAAVHLPIGLLIGNLVLTLLYLWRGDQTVEHAAYHCLWLGVLLLLPALATGTYEAVQLLVIAEHPRNDALGWINTHALLGVATLAVYWQAWQRRRRNPAVLADPRLRRSYLVLLVLGAVLLVIGGWVGGHMVYSLRLGVQS